MEHIDTILPLVAHNMLDSVNTHAAKRDAARGVEPSQTLHVRSRHHQYEIERHTRDLVRLSQVNKSVRDVVTKEVLPHAFAAMDVPIVQGPKRIPRNHPNNPRVGGERLEGGGVEGQAEVGVEGELLSSSMGLYS